MNVYITTQLLFLDALRGHGYTRKFGGIKVMFTLGQFILPFLFAIYSLVTIHEMYLIPLIAIILIHVMHAYKSNKSVAVA